MTRLHIFIAAALLLLSACNKGKNSIDGPDSAGGGEILTYEAAEKAIQKMDSVDWESPAVYSDVEQFFISARASLGESDKLALKRALKEHYAKQLTRTLGNILASDCAPRHAVMAGAVSALEGSDFGGFKPADQEDVMERYAKHQEQMKFAVSTRYDRGVRSFLEGYDDSYDRSKRSEAAAIRATNPTCSAIRGKVSEAAVNSALTKRRQDYYSRLVSKFCATQDISTYEYQQMLSKVSGAPQPAPLKQRIEAHWDKINALSEAAAPAEPAW